MYGDYIVCLIGPDPINLTLSPNIADSDSSQGYCYCNIGLYMHADCELIALLEDDTGMELLVCNKIISLDLPVKDVYKKIWCALPNVSTCV